MKIEIRHVQNGLVLRVEPEQEGEAADEYVYQKTESDEIEAFADFLRVLLNDFGPTTSRYSPKRILVVVESGDKCESSAIPSPEE